MTPKWKKLFELILITIIFLVYHALHPDREPFFNRFETQYDGFTYSNIDQGMNIKRLHSIPFAFNLLFKKSNIFAHTYLI